LHGKALHYGLPVSPCMGLILLKPTAKGFNPTCTLGWHLW
jgi:hypothetical protein